MLHKGSALFSVLHTGSSPPLQRGAGGRYDPTEALVKAKQQYYNIFVLLAKRLWLTLCEVNLKIQDNWMMIQCY